MARKEGETRGMWKGQINAGSFTSDDPRRIKLTPEHWDYRREFTQLCQEKSTDVVDFLHSTMMDGKQQGKIRLEAGRELLNRGFGRSVGIDVVASLDTAKTVNALPADLTDTEILRLLESGGALTSSSVPEAEYEVINQQAESPSEGSAEPATQRRRRGRARPTETNQEAEQ